jgi:MFS family permease
MRAFAAHHFLPTKRCYIELVPRHIISKHRRSGVIKGQAFAVIGDIFAPRDRGRYAGLFGAVFGLSSVAGPLVGGFITDAVGWHWCFFINIPVGALALTVIAAKMPALAPTRTGARPAIDVVGAIIFAGAIVPLLIAASLAKLELIKKAARCTSKSSKISYTSTTLVIG